ncbi:MAG: TonB-dependent receptor plug domain-containing protein, partial [Comamonas sp.]
MHLPTVQQLPFADSPDCVPLRPGPVALALRVLCAGTLASLAAAALAPQPARAQAAAQQGAAQRQYAIPAGPLETVLNRLGREAGALLTFDSTITDGLRSGGVNGRFAVQQALEQALQGTDLMVVRSAGGGYALRAIPTSQGAGGATLAAVTVTAAARGDGRTDGSGSYVAGPSAGATGLSLALRETPQSVTVVTRQQMDDMGMTTLPDALKAMPGVTSFQGSMLADRFLARGFEVGNENLRVDGASPMFRGFSVDHDLAFYDHVEVL